MCGFGTMLRKRTRSHQKDQNMGQLSSDVVSESHFHSDFLGHKHKNNSFFNVPGLFIGFNHPKGSESDSVRSPTSPLDFRLFSNFGNPFRSPRSSSHEGGHHKIWDGNKVGLGIIDSLDDEVKHSGKVLRASESKNILFGPQMRIKILKSPMHTSSSLDEQPKSLPKNIGIFPYNNNVRPSILQKGSSDVLFEIGAEPEPSFRPLSLDSVSSGSRLSRLAKSNHHPYLGSRSSFVCENGNSKLSNLSDTEQHSVQASVGSGNGGLVDTIPASEIELSEDYTCVRIHGPNPKVTHIFGDCILKCHNNELANFGKNNEGGSILPQTAECSNALISYPSNDFLSFCYSCKKKLDGEDIYMYRYAVLYILHCLLHSFLCNTFSKILKVRCCCCICIYILQRRESILQLELPSPGDFD